MEWFHDYVEHAHEKYEMVYHIAGDEKMFVFFGQEVCKTWRLRAWVLHTSTFGSWMMMKSSRGVMIDMRKHIVESCVPFMNKDGVYMSSKQVSRSSLCVGIMSQLHLLNRLKFLKAFCGTCFGTTGCALGPEAMQILSASELYISPDPPGESKCDCLVEGGNENVLNLRQEIFFSRRGAPKQKSLSFCGTPQQETWPMKPKDKSVLRQNMWSDSNFS